ncbi:MAG: hypothetical protein ACPGXK_06715 [Phycisphaerae bacterium]
MAGNLARYIDQGVGIHRGWQMPIVTGSNGNLSMFEWIIAAVVIWGSAYFLTLVGLIQTA